MTPYYENDGIVIYNGNCLDILPSLSGRAPNILCTDPPFAMTGGISNGRESQVSDQFFAHWWRDIATTLSGMLAPNGSGFIWCDWRTAKIIADGFKPRQSYESRWRVAQMLFHDRQMVGLGRPFRHSVDMLAYVRGPEHKSTQIPPTTSNLVSHYWRYGSHPHHPAQKSVSLVVQLLRWCLDTTDDCVIDPFMGSGTSMIAARMMGKKAIGIEVDEEYCEIAVQRLAQSVMVLE